MNLPPEFDPTVFLLENVPPSLPEAFAIITAWNPDGVTIDDDPNKAADRELLTELQRRDATHFRATGCSPDLLHREPGWAAVISKEEAIELGRHHQQLGIWWIGNDLLVLIDCTTGEEKKVARFSERISREQPDTAGRDRPSADSVTQDFLK